MSRSNHRETPPLVTLLTDFGLTDHYVGAVKGVVLSICPRAKIVDISHAIHPHDIQHGAFLLAQIWAYYPENTVHLAVVDPTVGTSRRIVAARYEGRTVVAPDNGLITFVHREFRLEELRVVENRRMFLQNVSSTFHARDIMAPVVGHLANGAPLRDVGPQTDHIEVLQSPAPRQLPGYKLEGQVVQIDTFGNLITNITHRQLTDAYLHNKDASVYLKDAAIGQPRGTYALVPRGAPLALIGSGDCLEIAINGGSAADHFGARIGWEVYVK